MVQAERAEDEAIEQMVALVLSVSSCRSRAGSPSVCSMTDRVGPPPGLGFMFYPLIRAAWLSLTNYSFFGTSQFIGLGNYTRLLHDPQFWGDLGNTAYYAAVTTPVSIVLALGLALLLNRRRLPARGHPAGGDLPAGCGVARRRRDPLPAHVHAVDRPDHLLARRDRHPRDGLARQHHAGHARRHHRRDMEERRVLHGHLHRWPADHPAGVLRGGAHRRRDRLAAVPA